MLNGIDLTIQSDVVLAFQPSHSITEDLGVFLYKLLLCQRTVATAQGVHFGGTSARFVQVVIVKVGMPTQALLTNSGLMLHRSMILQSR